MTQNNDEVATPPWDAARVNLTSKELAPGVFAVLPDDVFDKDHVATTAGFVIGERSVLVIESMLNGDLASQLIGLVRQVTTKPIRFRSTFIGRLMIRQRCEDQTKSGEWRSAKSGMSFTNGSGSF